MSSTIKYLMQPSNEDFCCDTNAEELNEKLKKHNIPKYIDFNDPFIKIFEVYPYVKDCLTPYWNLNIMKTNFLLKEKGINFKFKKNITNMSSFLINYLIHVFETKGNF